MKDWTTLITTLGNHISSGNRTEGVDMSMWDTLFPLAKEESCGTHVARYLATYQGDKYELFTHVSGTPLCINKIIERITLNKKAKQIEWSEKHQSMADEVGKVGGSYCYTIDYSEYTGIGFVAEWIGEEYCHMVGNYASLEDAKQACQDHLQAYVQLLKEQADGLYLQLQELTEE